MGHFAGNSFVMFDRLSWHIRPLSLFSKKMFADALFPLRKLVGMPRGTCKVVDPISWKNKARKPRVA
jgi:hypothetical protein